MGKFTLTSRIPQLTVEMERRAEALVKRTAFGIVVGVKVSMAEPKHGRSYKRGRKVHIASAPGEAPAIDYGNLVNSIEATVGGLHAVVGTNAEYAEILEFGGAKMEPRPYFGPAFEKAAPEFEAGLKEIVK